MRLILTSGLIFREWKVEAAAAPSRARIRSPYSV